jgi:hypothetical protein
MKSDFFEIQFRAPLHTAGSDFTRRGYHRKIEKTVDPTPEGASSKARLPK